jgi:hypothetical protein
VRVGISLMDWPWFTPPEQLALARQAGRLVATPATLGRRLAEYAVAGVDVLAVAPFGDRARLLDALAAHNSAPLTV